MSKATENLKKYLQAPSIEDIEKFMEEKGIKRGARLEHFYGIPIGTIRQIRHGNRCLPAKFWHIIYEHIKPAYGAGFLQKDGEVSSMPQMNRGQIVKNVFHKTVTTNVTTPKQITDISDKLAELLGD